MRSVHVGFFVALGAVGLLFNGGCMLDSTGSLFGGSTGTGGSGGEGAMSSSTGGDMGGSGGQGASTVSTGGSGGTTSSTGGGGTTSSTGGGGSTSSTGGTGGTGGAPPADNVTYDTLAMGCFKAVIIDDNTGLVVDGSGTMDVCPTELAGIYVPDGAYTLLTWVKDPSSNLLSFNSGENFTVTKAVCSTYATAPTWAQLQSDFANLSYTSVGNSALPPSYLFTESCANSAEYRFHK